MYRTTQYSGALQYRRFTNQKPLYTYTILTRNITSNINLLYTYMYKNIRETWSLSKNIEMETLQVLTKKRENK